MADKDDVRRALLAASEPIIAATHEALKDALGPLMGVDRGRIGAFRIYACVSMGEGLFVPLALGANDDGLVEPAVVGLERMIDHLEKVRPYAPSTDELREQPERN